MRRRIRVAQFLAAATVTQHGAHPTWNLLGVDYIREYPADREFPVWSGQFDLFTRFYLTGARPAEFVLRVVWNNAPSTAGRVVWESPRYPVAFRAD